MTIDPSEDGVWIIPPFVEESPPSPFPGERTESPAGHSPALIVRTNEAPVWPMEIREGGALPTTPAAPLLRRIRIEGVVPLESYTELFRCFVGPAAHMKLKSLELGVRFELEAQDNAPLDPNDPHVKAMREAARQLGLSWDADE